MRKVMHALLEERMRPFLRPKYEMFGVSEGHLTLTSDTTGDGPHPHDVALSRSWWNQRRLHNLASPSSSIANSDHTPPAVDITHLIANEYAKALHRQPEVPPISHPTPVGGWSLPVEQSLYAAHRAAVDETRTPADCTKAELWRHTLRGYEKQTLKPLRRRDRGGVEATPRRGNQGGGKAIIDTAALLGSADDLDDSASVSSSVLEGIFGGRRAQGSPLQLPVAYSQGARVVVKGKKKRVVKEVERTEGVSVGSVLESVRGGGGRAGHGGRGEVPAEGARYVELRATEWGAVLLDSRPPPSLCGATPICSMVRKTAPGTHRDARPREPHRRLHELPIRNVRDRAATVALPPEKPVWTV